ncbi:hypothetical protein B0H10DRAFT_2441432 [Mycena sp. CBHHK59/15]|nr:hypothetical protein B0H10DRAFT_2441432 [Mycena sp. CBHHK59/15]
MTVPCFLPMCVLCLPIPVPLPSAIPCGPRRWSRLHEGVCSSLSALSASSALGDAEDVAHFAALIIPSELLRSHASASPSQEELPPPALIFASALLSTYPAHLTLLHRGLAVLARRHP